MMTDPATKKLAPSHQSPGRVSRKMIRPRMAVTIKLQEVLITLTRTVLLARVRARVKRPHIIALKMRFRPKNACTMSVYWYRLDDE